MEKPMLIEDRIFPYFNETPNEDVIHIKVIGIIVGVIEGSDSSPVRKSATIKNFFYQKVICIPGRVPDLYLFLFLYILWRVDCIIVSLTYTFNDFRIRI